MPPASIDIERFAALCNTLGDVTGSTFDTFLIPIVGDGFPVPREAERLPYILVTKKVNN